MCWDGSVELSGIKFYKLFSVLASLSCLYRSGSRIRLVKTFDLRRRCINLYNSNKETLVSVSGESLSLLSPITSSLHSALDVFLCVWTMVEGQDNTYERTQGEV